jgi:AsmA-like C-terminal region
MVEAGLAPKPRFEGQGEITGFRLASVANKAEVGPELIPFVFAGGRTPFRKMALRTKGAAMSVPEGPHVELGPFPVAMGRATPVTLRGWINRSGYKFAIAGDAEVAKALRVSRTLSLPVPSSTAEGGAQLDLQIAGTWPGWSYGTRADFLAPQVTGGARLRNLRVSVRGTGGPVTIASADLQLASDEVQVNLISASVAGARWTGSLTMPRGCGTPAACEIQFNLKADQLTLSDLSEWANPRPEEQPWYRVLESSPAAAPSWLGTLRASGQVTTDELPMYGLTATHVSADVNIDRGKLQISELSAGLLRGRHRGAWEVDFRVKPAACKGAGSLNGLMLGRRAEATEFGISGMMDGTYQISGSCAELWTSAEGTLQFDLRDGMLTRISLVEDEGPLRILRMSGQARLHGGQIEMKDVRLDSPSGKFQLRGTASLQRELKLTLARGANQSAGGYTISGTLAAPRVELMVGTEQARLKAEAAR